MTARDIIARNLAWTREHGGITWLDFIRTHAAARDTIESTNDNDTHSAQGDECIWTTPKKSAKQ